jgi:hypothetical protein
MAPSGGLQNFKRSRINRKIADLSNTAMGLPVMQIWGGGAAAGVAL